MNGARLILFAAVLSLVGIGIVMSYSTSAIYAEERYGDEFHFLKRHLCWVGVGILALVVFSSLDYRVLRPFAPLALTLGIGALLLVFVPSLGRSAGGARRWIRLGSMSFQPSELTKLCLILFLAAYLARVQRRVSEFGRGFLLPIILAVCVVFLILLQPDFGTAMLLFAVAAAMMYVAGTRPSYLLGTGFLAVPAAYGLVLSSPYRMARLLTFLDPWKDPKGSGYQIIQSLIALGSGGWRGVGLAQSRQKYFYLPEAHTDFIYSVLGEETGFVGAALVLALFVFLLAAGMVIALRSGDLFGQLLAVGIVASLGLQTLINVGVVTGALPTKGLPLPFISFGGSNLLINMVGVGLLLSVGRCIAAGPVRNGRKKEPVEVSV